MCWKAADECVQKAATALIRQYAVAIYQHAVVGEHEATKTCRATLDNLEMLGPGKPASWRKEYDRIKDMPPLELGPYMRNIYTATQPHHLTDHGNQIKKFMLDKVFSCLAVRSATPVEQAMIFKLQDLVGVGGLDRHAISLATSVAVGKVSEDKVAMGLIESAMMKVENTDGTMSFRGRVSKCSSIVKDRLRCTALCMAARKCSPKLKDMIGVMKFPNIIQNKIIAIPSTYAALEDETRMRECALAVRGLSPENTSFVLAVDATCLAAGVLPCSDKWSPIDGPVMLGGVWHWNDECNPIIKSRSCADNQWSPQVTVTEVVPATYMMVITLRRGDHSFNHTPILELPLLRESMPQEQYAKIIAATFNASVASGLPTAGIAYDGTGCADLVDGVLLSYPPSCKRAILKEVPLFSAVVPCGFIFPYCIYRGAMFNGEYLSGWTSPSRDLLLYACLSL